MVAISPIVVTFTALCEHSCISRSLTSSLRVSVKNEVVTVKDFIIILERVIALRIVCLSCTSAKRRIYLEGESAGTKYCRCHPGDEIETTTDMQPLLEC